MASKRKYGYYIKGNKIAIIEEGTGSGICSLSGYSSQTTCEDAGGTWTENAVSTNDGEYRSPVATVSDGLEIQYAYSPSYIRPARAQSDAAGNTTYFAFNGWIVVDGYLTLVSSGMGFGVYANNAVDSYILIEGSERWNGIHKIQEVQGTTSTTHGSLKTYTKVSTPIPRYFIDTGCAWTTDEAITGINTDFDDQWGTSSDVGAVQSTPIWISGSSAPDNNGLFINWKWTIPNPITLDFSSATRLAISELEESEETPDFDADSDDTIYIYEAFREVGGAYFTAAVDVMDDESFDLDLSRYQANAIVYYLKARLAEDVGDIEKREFFMREFKRQLEKSTSALKRGPYIVQGLKELR